MNATTDMAKLLAAEVDRLFADTVDVAVLRAAEAGESSSDLAAAVAALELETALVSELHGGAGLGFSDLAGVFEAIGYHAAPVEIGEDILARWALDRTAIAQTDVAPVLLAEPLAFDRGKGTVSGTGVVCGRRLREDAVALAADGDRTLIVVLRAKQAEVRAVRGVARDPRLAMTFRAAVPRTMAEVDLAPDALRARLAVLRAAQISGALSRCLMLSIDYANTRVQFGRAIGKFQAIQHIIAELASEAAAAKAGVQAALRGFDDGCDDAAAVAKIRASIAAGKGAAIAHAVHGAIGVTEEHTLHYFTRRLWQWRDDAGDEHVWAERLGRAVLARPGTAFWPALLALSEGRAVAL